MSEPFRGCCHSCKLFDMPISPILFGDMIWAIVCGVRTSSGRAIVCGVRTSTGRCREKQGRSLLLRRNRLKDLALSRVRLQCSTGNVANPKLQEEQWVVWVWVANPCLKLERQQHFVVLPGTSRLAILPDKTYHDRTDCDGRQQSLTSACVNRRNEAAHQRRAHLLAV